MVVVDGVEVKVLNMPAESSKHHPYRHPRNSDSTNLVLLIFNHPQERVGGLVDVIQVEQVALVFKVRVQPIMNFAARKPASIQ